MIADNASTHLDEDFDDDAFGELETDDQIAEAFLNLENKLGADKPPVKADDEDEDEVTDEHDADEADGSDGNEADDHDEDHSDKGEATLPLDDDLEFEHPVDGVLQKFKLKDAKRWAGKESVLNQKLQEVATREKEVEAGNRDKYALQSKALRDRAYEKYKPYETTDWMAEQARYLQAGDIESFNAVRAYAKEMLQEVQFYDNELQHVEKERQASIEQFRQVEAAKCIDVLRVKLPEFDGNSYAEQKKFAADHGLDASLFNQIVNPGAFILIDMAMKYAKGQAAKTKPIPKSPKKVASGKANVEEVRRNAKPRPKPTGPLNDRDEIANAFMKFV